MPLNGTHSAKEYLSLLKDSITARTVQSLENIEVLQSHFRMSSNEDKWPGMTHLGNSAINALCVIAQYIAEQGLKGGVLDLGSWRGGAALFMRAALDVVGDKSRYLTTVEDVSRHDEIKINFKSNGIEIGRVNILGWASLRDNSDTSLSLLLIEDSRGCKYLPEIYERITDGGLIFVSSFQKNRACTDIVNSFRKVGFSNVKDSFCDPRVRRDLSPSRCTSSIAPRPLTIGSKTLIPPRTGDILK